MGSSCNNRVAPLERLGAAGREGAREMENVDSGCARHRDKVTFKAVVEAAVEAAVEEEEEEEDGDNEGSEMRCGSFGSRTMPAGLVTHVPLLLASVTMSPLGDTSTTACRALRCGSATWMTRSSGRMRSEQPSLENTILCSARSGGSSEGNSALEECTNTRVGS